VGFFPEYDDGDFEGYEGYASLEDAARGDIPEQYAKVVQVEISDDGDQATVLLAANESPAIEYEVTYCARSGGRWYPLSGGNANGPQGELPWSA
jgi:hypothetical protein